MRATDGRLRVGQGDRKGAPLLASDLRLLTSDLCLPTSDLQNSATAEDECNSAKGEDSSQGQSEHGGIQPGGREGGEGDGVWGAISFLVRGPWGHIFRGR